MKKLNLLAAFIGVFIFLTVNSLTAADKKQKQKVTPPPPPAAAVYNVLDFGHSHWHNSLIWGENLQNISILGPGVIFGKGLVRGTNNAPDGSGNKSISLKSCFGLGVARATENVTITNCQVSGYEAGSLLDGTYKRDEKRVASGGPTGRIKFGTESNGGFKNITISNCVFDFCRGLALEAVDGALLEDITITNITMRDIVNASIFLRLGERMRSPENTLSFNENDFRPAFFLDDVKNAEFIFVKARKAEGVPSLSLKNVTNLSLFQSLNLSDRKIDKADNDKL